MIGNAVCYATIIAATYSVYAAASAIMQLGL